MEPRFSVFTVSQVAKQLQMSDDRVYRLLQAGKMPGLNIDGQWRIPAVTLFQWLTPEWGSAGVDASGADRTSL